jgi:thymidine kinase
MTPKEKARELVERYDDALTYLESKEKAKQCAMIAVDECIKHEKQIVEQIKSLQLRNSFIVIINDGSFWRQVKHEIVTFKQ